MGYMKKQLAAAMERNKPAPRKQPLPRQLSPGAQQLYDSIMQRRAARMAAPALPAAPSAGGLGTGAGVQNMAAGVANRVLQPQQPVGMAAPPRVQTPMQPMNPELRPLAFADGGKIVKDHFPSNKWRR